MRKKSLRELQKRLERLNQLKKAVEVEFYTRLGKEIEKVLENENCTISDIRNKYEEVRKKFVE